MEKFSTVFQRSSQIELFIDRVRKFLNIFKTYESPFVIWLSYLPVMILTKADDIQVRTDA